MDAEIKQKWVNALLSGEYKQTKDQLKNEQGYCCLGVLTDLYCKDVNKQWDELIHNGGETLPDEVVEWAGTRDANPTVEIKSITVLDTITLSSLNDRGSDFKELANLIEEDETL